ncbi:MAG: hypothetical protein H7138_21995 [Myxococcales bacterium]|nr:hypothetical protein [Myxococcales bacterium]
MGLVVDMYGPEAAEPAPPEAQRWAYFLSHGVKPRCTFVRRRTGATWGPPRIVVSYPDAQPAMPPDPVVPWDPVLEDWLLEHRVAAPDAANEAARFGFDLGARFEAIERRCGTPTFTAVLLRCLYDHDCALYLPLERKLGAIRTYEPDPSTASTAVGCALKQVMCTSAELLGTLGYPPDQTRAILGEALAYYLRDRFDI